MIGPSTVAACLKLALIDAESEPARRAVRDVYQRIRLETELENDRAALPILDAAMDEAEDVIAAPASPELAQLFPIDPRD